MSTTRVSDAERTIKGVRRIAIWTVIVSLVITALIGIYTIVSGEFGETQGKVMLTTLAVAGFREDDLAITVEDRQLVIRGRQSDDDGNRVFLHRGIAARAFQRSFVLADGVEVAGATMENGLLHIDLQRSAPEMVVQTIRIGSRTGER
jgi:hypothetical protein